MLTSFAPKPVPGETMIEIIKPTRVSGKRVAPGDFLVAGSDVEIKDASILIRMGLAKIVDGVPVVDDTEDSSDVD